MNDTHKFSYTNNNNFKFGFDRRMILSNPHIIDCKTIDEFITNREPIINKQIDENLPELFTPIIEEEIEEEKDEEKEEVEEEENEVVEIEAVEDKPVLIDEPVVIKSYLKDVKFNFSKPDINKKPSLKMSGNKPSSR